LNLTKRNRSSLVILNDISMPSKLLARIFRKNIFRVEIDTLLKKEKEKAMKDVFQTVKKDEVAQGIKSHSVLIELNIPETVH
jgi:hypothetical protein